MRTLLLSLLLASSALAQGMPGPVASAAWRPSRASGGGAAGDPIRGVSRGTTERVAETTTGYSGSTASLLWLLESGSSSRSVRIDAGSEGTNTDASTPAAVDRIGLGGYLDSTPDRLLAGSIGHVGLLNVSSVEERANFHRFYRRYVSTLE